MRAKTEGIVLGTFPFRESSVMIRMYTEAFGLQTYLENGVRSAKGKTKMAFFQPLTWLEMEVYHDPRKDIQRLSEYKCPYPFQTIPYDIHRSSIALFLAEICQKTLKEAAGNAPLFHFIRDHLVEFDQQEKTNDNFHLFFLTHLATYLGFEVPSGQLFQQQLHEQGIAFMWPEVIETLRTCVHANQLILPSGSRRPVLEALIWYYRLHIQDFGEIKSWAVLRTVLAS